MKKGIYWLLTAALMVPAAVSCKHSPKTSRPAEPDRLVVMSYNVRNSKADDGDNAWEIRRSATAAMLDSVRPDIFGVQEAYPDQEAYITEQCPRYSAFGVGRDDGRDAGERMTVFYDHEKLEMAAGGTWWLSETPDEPSVGWDAKYPRTATWVLMKDLRCGGREFYLVNTHLDHRGIQAQRNGLAMVMEKIHAMNPDTPLVLMGDFNVEPGDPTLTDVDSLMVSARVSASVTEDTPSFNGYDQSRHKVIDYIYYSGFAGADSFRVVTESYDGKPYISDHYPIVSTLRY